MAHTMGTDRTVHTLCLKICVVASIICVVEGEVGRQLSYPQICGYEPGSDVQTHARIDLDQEEFEGHLAKSDFAKAKAVYSLGGNTGATAVITISPLAEEAAYYSQVKQGSVAIGNLKLKAAVGETVLKVHYMTSCKDGGLSTKDLAGCFKVGGGALTISGKSVGEPTVVSNTYDTLQGFSVQGKQEMGGWRWQELFSVYRAYYNEGAYANSRVMAALDKTGICQSCDTIARVEIAKKTSAYMNVWMYVVAKMEEAIVNCRHGCVSCKLEHDLSGGSLLEKSSHAWDEAVAYYAGSLEGVDGTNSGKLLFELAQKRCANFGTCTAQNGGAAVNTAIIDQFRIGQAKILSGKCVDAIAIKRRIVNLMSVPLVQGALRYAYKIAVISEDGSKEKAEGAAFSAAVLPRIAACSSSAAKIISDNMDLDSSAYMSAGYVKVKEAFEKTYACLGITCEEVGDIIKSGDAYYDLAEPCKPAAPPVAASNTTEKESSDDMVLIIILIVVGVLLLVMIVLFIVCCLRARKYQKLAEGKAGPQNAIGVSIGNGSV